MSCLQSHPMSYNKVLIGFVLVSFAAVGCGSTDKANDSTGTGGAAPAPTGTGGVAPTAGTGGAVATGTGTGGAAAPAITECGGVMCPAAGMIALLRPTCCTADNKCGTASAMTPTVCELPYVNTSKCPETTILGQMVPGCCMDDMTTCGVKDISGLFGGGCNSRCSSAALSPGILPASCSDGVPMGMCPAAAGTGGMGTGGTGTGGMGTGGTGTGGTGTGGMGTGGMGTGGKGTGGTGGT